MKEEEVTKLIRNIHKLTDLEWDKKEFAGADSFLVWFYLKKAEDSKLIEKFIQDNGISCRFWTEADCFMMEV